MSQRFRATLAAADRLGRGLENVVLVVLLTGMILLAGTQIFLRNVLDSGLGWADPALRMLVLWIALVGAVAASRDARQLRIDLLSRYLTGRRQMIADAVVNVITAAVAATVAWYSLEFVIAEREFADPLIGPVPGWVFQTVLPVTFFLMAWRHTVWAIKLGFGDPEKDEGP